MRGGLKRTAVASAARLPGFGLGVSLAERVVPTRSATLPILTYHRIADPASTPELDPRLVSATPSAFREQMTTLAERHDFLSADDLLAIRRGERDVARRTMMVTFDDAYRDFAEHAWPVLRELSIPVTLFVATAFANGDERAFWWDRVYAALISAPGPTLATPFGSYSLATANERLHAVRFVQDRLAQLPHDELVDTVQELCGSDGAARPTVLDWAELRLLAAEGVTLAPHTRTHPLLNRVPVDRARAEIVGSLDELERNTGAATRLFAFPGGAYTDEVLDVLEQEGFEVAMTTERGINRLDAMDWLRLRRINVGQSSNAALIRAQVALYSSVRARTEARVG